MGSITSLFVRKVAAAVDDAGAREGLLRSVGVEPGPDVDSSGMLTDVDYYAFFERAAAADSDPSSLPLRVGASMRCDEYGAFGLAWKSALDLRGSYRRAERYARVLTSVSTYEVEPTGQGAYMHLRRDGDRGVLGLRLSNEASLASVAAISRQVSTQPFAPLAVFFRHEGPESGAGHEDHFGCPVHFDSDRDALLVSEASLRAPNRLGDATIARFFDSHLEAALTDLETDESLDRRVRGEVAHALSEGVPSVSDVARELGMSARTLQRRLAEEGHSFQSLVDESRRQLAERLLRGTDFSLVEVAYMTGYSEQSAFTRAFRRWAGQTPRSYRIEALGQGREQG